MSDTEAWDAPWRPTSWPPRRRRLRTSRRCRARSVRQLDGLYQSARLAGMAGTAGPLAGRGQRRVDGTYIRSDSTIEAALPQVRDLARFLVDERAKTDWATGRPTTSKPSSTPSPATGGDRLRTRRQFFGWGRRNKLVLVDLSSAVTLIPRPGFTAERSPSASVVSALDEKPARCGTPNEALVALLAMLHALTDAELRALPVNDVDL